MEWLNIHRSTIEGEPMQDAPPEAVRAWLFLSVYCAGQENGGRIEGARQWSERKWLKLCGLCSEDVAAAEDGRAPGLWHWDGDDLVVEFYPVEQEAFIRNKRRAGKAGGRKSGEARRSTPSSSNEAHLQAELEAESGKNKAHLERKGREGKEKEGKEREGAPAEDDVLIPTEVEVRTWAERVGVDPEFAAQKWAATSEAHGWVQNGELIDWQRRWKRYWLEDQNEWKARQKRKAAQKSPGQFQNGEKPPGWKEGDQEWWWSEDVEMIEKALHGALLGGQEETAERLREILKTREV